MKNITELKVGKYLLKVGEFPEGFKFSIINPDKSLFKMGIAKSENEAIEEAKSAISKHNKEIQGQRINGIPTASEYAEALTAIQPTQAQWDMLKAHYNAPDRKLTSSQLADAASYVHLYGANTQYGALGHKLSDYLNFKPPGTYKSGEPLWITVIANHSELNVEEDTGHFQHELREELAEALEILGAT